MRKKKIKGIVLMHNESIFKNEVIYEIYLGEKDERYKQYSTTNNSNT